MRVIVYMTDGKEFDFYNEDAYYVADRLEKMMTGFYHFKDEWITVKNKKLSQTFFIDHVIGFSVFTYDEEDADN